MTEVMPSWFYPLDLSDLDGRTGTHPCHRLDSIQSYTPSSPLIFWSSSIVQHDAGRLSEDMNRILDFEERISRRGLREIIQRCNVGNLCSRHEEHGVQLSLLALFLAAVKRSLLACKTVRTDNSMEIGCPTNAKHIAHVTFDKFNGFLGLPVEFEVEIPQRVPSASASVFGVSAESMQCSYDRKGNSVPTILLLIQQKLYRQGGLQAEGIFRINAENSHEEEVRQQLNKGIVPDDVDLHCLAGLIKAWFRELPKGVLDSLAPEQVMQCSTEEQCLELMKQLPATEAALLDWAINLMADVVQEEELNKMNARNIAMVFAPNMTQMVDPLTALMHAVQVMNFLKTLILKTLRERHEAALDPRPVYTCAESSFDDDFDTDNGSPFLHGYSEHDSLEEEDCIQEVLMPPFRSPNKITSSDDDCSPVELGNVFFSDFDEQFCTGVPTYQDGGILSNCLLSNEGLKDVKVKRTECRNYALVYPDSCRDQPTYPGMKIVDDSSTKRRHKNLDDYYHLKGLGFHAENMVLW